jgi:hypothetical protein
MKTESDATEKPLHCSPSKKQLKIAKWELDLCSMGSLQEENQKAKGGNQK